MRIFKRQDLQVPVIFMISGLLWIIFSDQIFLHFSQNASPVELTRLQTFKGTFFVIVVTILIYTIVKEAHKQLLQSKKEYRELFEKSPNPLANVNAQTEIYSNVIMTAADPQETLEKEIEKLPIENVPVENIKSALANSTAKSLHKNSTKDEHTVADDDTTRDIIYDYQPKSLLFSNDTVRLEKAKAAMVRKEKQLEQILDSITDGFFILNNCMTVIKANEQFKKLIPVPGKDVEGKLLVELFPNLANTELYQKYMLAIENSTTLHYEHFYEHKKMWISLSAYPFEDGLSVLFKDITKEKSGELERFKSEQNLRSLINNTEDFIWSIDSEFKYFTFNEPFENAYTNLFGKKLWIGKSALNDNQGGDQIEKWRQLYQRALDGEKFCTEMEIVVKGVTHYTTVRFNPIYSIEKKVVGVGCFLQDITERKQYEHKISRQNDQLKNIAFITSHKVRAPLANILGLSEILDTEDPLSPSNLQVIEYIKASAKELDTTIRGMAKEAAQTEVFTGKINF